MSLFSTTDLDLASYLIVKGYQVISTRKDGRWTEFLFGQEVEGVGEQWEHSPNEEMKLLQSFLFQKEKLLRKVRPKERRSYERNRLQALTKH